MVQERKEKLKSPHHKPIKSHKNDPHGAEAFSEGGHKILKTTHSDHGPELSDDSSFPSLMSMQSEAQMSTVNIHGVEKPAKVHAHVVIMTSPDSPHEHSDSLNRRQSRMSVRSVESGSRSRMSVASIRRTLKATKAGRITLRTAERLRHFVAQRKLFPGQKFKNSERVNWQHEPDSLFSLVAFAVGLGNLARFPYKCYTYGGSAFLIPYFMFLIFSAFPLLYMELILGQFVQQGVISVWKIVPIFRGIGYCICIILILISSYYLSPLAWSMIFIWESIYSIGNPVPWTTCDNPWNSVGCVPFTGPSNQSKASDDRDPATEFFKGRVLRYYKSAYADSYLALNNSYGNETFGFGSKHGLGDPVLDLSLCLLFVSFCLLVLANSEIRITGKFVWFTSITAFLILMIILTETVTLSGAKTGIEALITPNFTSLANPETWAVASIQVFLSTGVGFGVHLTHASHNKFHHNIFRDAIITVVTNSVWSIIGAILVFANLGSEAEAENRNISDVVPIGISLVFETLAEGFAKNPINPRFVAVLFYFMVFIIGFDSVMGGVQAIVAGFKDEFPDLMRANQAFFLFAIIAFAYVFNLISVTRGGVWMYRFMDTYAAEESLILAVLIQTVVVTWIWGMDELCDAVIAMTGRTPGLYLRLCWKYIAPLSLFLSFWVSLLGSSSVLELDGKLLSKNGQIVGKIMTYLPFAPIPLYILYHLAFYNKETSFREYLRLMLSPENEHDKMLATGVAGSRFTWGHILFFGGWKYSHPVKVSPEQRNTDVYKVNSEMTVTSQTTITSSITDSSDHKT